MYNKGHRRKVSVLYREHICKSFGDGLKDSRGQPARNQPGLTSKPMILLYTLPLPKNGCVLELFWK